jgi:hypothetical protein
MTCHARYETPPGGLSVCLSISESSREGLAASNRGIDVRDCELIFQGS